MRPRLVVVTPSMAEAVRSAGGWLFDRVTAGWDVTVLTADHADSRPLRILGARAVDLDAALAAPAPGMRPRAIAVDAGLCGSDARVRRLVLDALGDERVDVRLWGNGWPAAHAGEADAVRHRLSFAARAFKAHALAATAAPACPCEPTEIFRRSEPPRSSVSA